MITDIRLVQNRCVCCDADTNNLERLWKYEHVTKTLTKKWHFNVNNSICNNCGMVFQSPTFSQSDLEHYYSDSRVYHKIDYDIQKRINVCSKYSSTGKEFIELGAKQKTEFHKQLVAKFKSVSTYGLESNSEFDVSASQLSSGAKKFDVLAHYFVLEHVPDPKAFLMDCRSYLNNGGVMITEVPDIAKYPHDIAALMLYEHTNHFSIQKLTEICFECGFKLTYVNHDEASRSFGMVAVFKKINIPTNPEYSCEYRQNKKFFIDGLTKVQKYYELLEKTRSSLINNILNKYNTIIWGANEICSTLLDPLITADISKDMISSHLTIIDSDPSKEDHISDYKCHTPDAVLSEIQSANCIIICTSFWSQEILNDLNVTYRKSFDKKNILVIDYA